MNDMQGKQKEVQERLRKALLQKKKQQLEAKREAYRRTQMDEFRDGMVSLVTDPETKEVSKDIKKDEINIPVAVQKDVYKKGLKRSNERMNAFKMSKRRKGRAA